MEMTSVGSQYPWGVSIRYQDYLLRLMGQREEDKEEDMGKEKKEEERRAHAMFAECLSIQMLHAHGQLFETLWRVKSPSQRRELAQRVES